MALRQPISRQYYFDMDAKAMIQLTLQIESPDVIPKLIDYYKNTVIPLHLKQEGNYLVHHNDYIPVFEIPHNEHTRTLADTANYVSQHYTRPFTESLASISAGDNKVVLNIVHCIADGGYFKLLVDGFLNGIYPRNHKLAPFPDDSIDLYSNLIKKAPSSGYLWADNPYTTRVTTHDPQFHPSDTKKGISYYTIRTPSKSLKCYNPKKNKISGFSEVLWLSQILAAMAHKDQMIESGGVTTCVDLRQWIENPQKVDPFSVCNSFSAVTPFSEIEPNMTLKQLARNLRNNLNYRLNRLEQFSFVKAFNSEQIENHEKKDTEKDTKLVGSALEITSMGTLNLKRPLVDAWTSFTVLPVHAGQIVSLMSFGVKSEEIDDVILRLRYSADHFSDREMKVYGKSIDYFLHNIDNNLSVKEALYEIKRFQSHI
ncbi:hypothetical protein M9Y10_009729 [Tritrichomonas musculus]|uniref:Condensation domain-containing protein n=1 Tax=Tritrichomonas musculus TaxID=1915356 RepID=A0ABR2IQP2_9EUKA